MKETSSCSHDSHVCLHVGSCGPREIINCQLLDIKTYSAAKHCSFLESFKPKNPMSEVYYNAILNE